MNNNTIAKYENRMRILPGNGLYTSAVRRETLTWGSHFVLEQRRSIEYSYPPIVAYRNQVITGDPNITWQEFMKAKYGVFEKALSIGVGTGWIEESLIKSGIVRSIEMSDISQAAVEHVAHRLQPKDNMVEVSVRMQDANFIDLQPETYDLILCNSILHHVINLEHLLNQLNLALKKTGLLVVDEFIGSSRWQWSQQTCDLINAAMSVIAPERKRRPLRRSELAVMIMSSPFESIRSSEISSLVSFQFENAVLLERHFMGFLYPAICTLDFSDWSDPSLRGIVEKCIQLDVAFNRVEVLPQNFLFGIYTKGHNQSSAVLPLPPKDIQKLLNPIWSATPLRMAKWILGPVKKQLERFWIR